MYLGNSRMLLGKNTNDIVYGEWKAVAPSEATNGTYGTTGEVKSLEWISSYNTLMVGGQFKNFVSGSQEILMNSIAKFNGDWFGLTSSGAGATTGVLRTSSLGIVWSIRDIKHSGTSYIVLVGGDFDQAGYLSRSGLNIAQYSMESGWTGNADTFAADDTVVNISNVAYSSSSGATAYISGIFSDVGGTQSIFSPNIAAYYRNFSTNTGDFPDAGGFGVAYSIGLTFNSIDYSGVYDGRMFVYGIDKIPAQSLKTFNPITYNFTGTQNLDSLSVGAPYETFGSAVSVVTSSPTTASLYLSTGPIVKYTYFPSVNTSTLLTGSSIDNYVTCINKVFYNSGTHLIIGAASAGSNNNPIIFYNIESGNIKPIPFPDSSGGTRVNSIAVDDNTGTVYVGGSFEFRDSDGNTAWNVAKFVPDASKLPT